MTPQPESPPPRSRFVGILAKLGKETPLFVLATAIVKIVAIFDFARQHFWDINYSTPYVHWTVLVLLASIHIAGGIVFYRVLFPKVQPKLHLNAKLVGGILVIALGGLFWRTVGLLDELLPTQQPQDIAGLETRWTGQLFDTQSDAGVTRGFSTKQVGPGEPDAWTSAQALNAILRGPNRAAKASDIKRAFDFIESSYITTSPGGNGWVTRAGFRWPRTEITAWVVLAYEAGLRVDGLWGPDEIPRIRNRVLVLLTDLAGRQNPTTEGGWGPTTLQLANSDRTYSEVMVLWSMVEARRTKPMGEVVGTRFDRTIRRGISALLRVPHQMSGPHGGWLQRLGASEFHPGLAAHALYVLSLAAEDHDLFKGTDLEEFDAAREAFLLSFTLEPEFYKAVDRTSGDEQAIQDDNKKNIEEPFYVTFFPYPWSVALFSHMASERALSHRLRSKASSQVSALQQQLRSNDAVAFFKVADTYWLAENQIGVECGGTK